jgi:acyl-CoA synthetase (AMP-forming)/AMP-acid ligase II
MNCVDYLFENSHDLSKDFILSGRENVSFKELWARVNQLSNWLSQEFGAGNKILLSAANGSFFVVSYLAIMKSGNAVVPLNPAIEKEGLDYISERCRAKIGFLSILVHKRLNAKLDVLIDEKGLEEILSKEDIIKTDFGNSFPEDHLAQIIYTSGSTALPKGVMLSHKNIIANTASIIEYLKLTANDTMLVVLPFFYCYGLSLLHTHLRVGGQVALNNNFMFLGSVLNDLKKYNCSGFAGVPSHFQILLRKSDSFINSEFPYLKYVTQAGGKLHTVFIEEFRQHFPAVKFYVMYGQTEATARLSYLPPERLNDKLGSIGKGIPGVLLDVVNAEGKRVQEGEVGEIVAKGDNVMLGYYEEPEETQETIKDGWLYTGDLARMDRDGFIYHAARKKEIIKVGGKRVSPKEIEEVIVSMPGVVDCTISAEEDSVLGEAIKAALVVNPDHAEMTVENVREYCSQHLAAYKIPTNIVFEDKVNVNAAGKKVKQ